MRDFLYSEIANFYGIQNIPENPDLAIEVGKRLCEELLEPLNATFGRLAVRSVEAPGMSGINDVASVSQAALVVGAGGVGSQVYLAATNELRPSDGTFGPLAASGRDWSVRLPTGDSPISTITFRPWSP